MKKELIATEKDALIKQYQGEKTLLEEENARLKERVAYLERMLYGNKSDKLRVHEQDNNPGLFDDYFKEVHDEKIAQVEKVTKETEQVAEKRRQNSKKTPNRPKTYCIKV